MAAEVILNTLFVVSQPKPEASEVMLLVPLKNAIWPDVPEPPMTPVPAQEPQLGAEAVVAVKHWPVVPFARLVILSAVEV